jgi:hypothetical protein
MTWFKKQLQMKKICRTLSASAAFGNPFMWLVLAFGNPVIPANVSEVVGNPLANLIQKVRGYWQPSENFYRVLKGIGSTVTNSSG